VHTLLNVCHKMTEYKEAVTIQSHLKVYNKLHNGQTKYSA
jgi:hypothetical protein